MTSQTPHPTHLPSQPGATLAWVNRRWLVRRPLARNRVYHLLVECLVEQGVTHAFGVPGESYLAVLDGFHQHADRIRFITNRQEGGAAFMAEAHGKLTGRPGVCLVTRAWAGGHQCVHRRTHGVSGFHAHAAAGGRCYQRLPRPRGVSGGELLSFFGPLAKRVERIDDASRIPEYIARAFATAMNGRPGPVVLVLPEDMLTQTRPPARCREWSPRRPGATPVPCATLRQLLLQAQRPLVLAGGGGWTPQAAQAAATLCRELATAGGQHLPVSGHV